MDALTTTVFNLTIELAQTNTKLVTALNKATKLQTELTAARTGGGGGGGDFR